MSTSGKKSALIFLHGLGDCGSSWQSALESEIPKYVALNCPTASNSPVTINFGMSCNSWFDITSLDNSKPEDEKSIHSACERVHKMIADLETKGFDSERIMLGGFSQGGALSLYSALKYPKKLAGVVALSCWLPLHNEFPAATSAANKNLSILQCHGDSDVIVSLDWARRSHEVLKQCVPSERLYCKIYENMGHSSCQQEINDVVEHIKNCLPDKKD